MHPGLIVRSAPQAFVFQHTLKTKYIVYFSHTNRIHPMKEPFLINNRFLVDPVKKNLLDKRTNEELQLESRLVETLCRLAATPGRLVIREQLWDDYDRSEEGLQQAIILLRKLLLDHDENIIKGIPRKGYILNAAIKPASAKDSAPAAKRAKLLIMAGIVVLLMIGAYFSYVFIRSGDQPVMPAPASSGPDTIHETVHDSSGK
jgi:DNA-binding winged helix-turn-helix (wHTH) protein